MVVGCLHTQRAKFRQVLNKGQLSCHNRTFMDSLSDPWRGTFPYRPQPKSLEKNSPTKPAMGAGGLGGCLKFCICGAIPAVWADRSRGNCRPMGARGKRISGRLDPKLIIGSEASAPASGRRAFKQCSAAPAGTCGAQMDCWDERRGMASRMPNATAKKHPGGS